MTNRCRQTNPKVGNKGLETRQRLSGETTWLKPTGQTEQEIWREQRLERLGCRSPWQRPLRV